MKKTLLALTAALLTLATAACASGEGDDERTTMVISYQDTAFPALIEASGLLDGADFDIEWANLSGPASNLQALYSGAIDLGHMGDTSLTIEQANSDTEWTEENAPLRIVAGWRSARDDEHSPLVTAVRTSSGIDDIAEARGHAWAYNFGGYNHAQYLISLVQAGLSEDDIEPTQFADGASSAAAFNNGEVDVYSGAQGAILSSLNSGDARILLRDSDTDIPALNVWTARSDVLDDPAKDAALQDFFERLSGYFDWHAEHPDEVKEILKSSLKLDDERTEFEYIVRGGAFQTFHDDLLAEEQAVAQSLYDGDAIERLPEVSISFDGRYNEAQGAVESAAEGR